MRNEVEINVNMITWAISRAGYELHEFATKSPKVLDWLENKKKPTVKQLEKFSHQVHLPFGYLFLPEPPAEKLPFPFFRTGNTPATNVSVNVHDSILLMQRRQEWLRDYLTDNEFEPLNFVGKYNKTANPQTIVSDIRETLGLHENWASNLPTWQKALDYLSQKVENAGIIIVFNSVVENNTHRPIEVEECRGFVLVDDIAPFMFINAADSKAAQMFTIVHELAHIWTGQSAGFDFRQMQPANNPIEKLCDKVAAEFLVPAKSFNDVWQVKNNIKYLSGYFKVSPIVIARRALDLNKITKRTFFIFYNDYVSRLQFKKDNQTGGGDFYATTKKRLNLKFAAHINQAVNSNKLLYRDAYKLTGLKGNTYQTFFNEHFLK